MNWSIDHLAVTAHDWDRSVAFYEAAFGMVRTKLKLVDHPDLVNHPEVAEILGPGCFAHMLDPVGSSLHIIKAIPNFYLRYPALKKDFTNTHVAITLDDLDAVKARFDERRIVYEVPREWGPTGYERLYVDDPSSNVIEPNQRVPLPPQPAGEPPAAAPPATATWRIDHVNIVSFDLPRSVAWFTELLDLTPGEASELPAEQRVLYGATPDRFAFFPEHKTGRPGVHISVPDPEVTARNDWWLNPVMRGHTAITVEDFDEVAANLTGLGVRYQDCGAVEDKRILYTYDPAMNVLEVNQDI